MIETMLLLPKGSFSGRSYGQMNLQTYLVSWWSADNAG